MEVNMEAQMRLLLFIRVLLCGPQVAARPEMSKEAKRVYDEVLAPVADVFVKSHDAVGVAENTVAEKGLQVRTILLTFDSVYRTTRSIVFAFSPAKQNVPDTLKAQPTETDMLRAVATLGSIVKSHAGEGWADDIMTGQFGTLAPQMEGALNGSIAAKHALETARQARVNAYLPAYHGYLAFKRVVRNLLGPSSIAYRQLHPRAVASEATEPAEEAAPDSGVMPASKGTPLAVSEPPSRKTG
jgi:hypothetical protein